MDDKRLYGVLFVQEELDRGKKYQPSYLKKDSHIQLGKDTTGEIKIKSEFNYEEYPNPITVRCYWPRNKYPERGEMHDLLVRFYWSMELKLKFPRKGSYWVSRGEIQDTWKISLGPSAIDLRPTFQTGGYVATGWLDDKKILEESMQYPSFKNKEAWETLCKEKEKNNG